MIWNPLNSVEQLKEIDGLSQTKPVLIFKHSMRCNISSTALNRIERTWEDQYGSLVTPYYLDLIANRNTSNEVAQHYGISHESPQVLLIKNGKCSYSESHMGINLNEILRQIKA